ncbi:MAG: hypothetical protein SGJ11_15775 [Phycisphaerae bacterium]|nr:hypothetical protein [Phycisphaerae bacterium]
MTQPGERATVTLHAALGEPLRDNATRSMVVATVHAIAERNGVRVMFVDHDERRVTVTLAASSIVAVGLAVELRRVTNAWHQGKFGTPIWDAPGDAP